MPIGMLAGYMAAVIAADNSQTTISEEIAPVIEPTSVQDALDPVQNPMQMGAMQPKEVLGSPRYRQEKTHLMKRMNRKHGKWGPTHPRYRLLEALFSYSKYRDSNMAELDRWRGLYKNVGKQQKKGSRNRKLNAHLLIRL
jgi:hypothetical protein